MYFCISDYFKKRQGSKLLSIQTRFLKNHFQICKQAARKFALNFRSVFEQPSPDALQYTGFSVLCEALANGNEAMAKGKSLGYVDWT
jgi:hypothetical protein